MGKNIAVLILSFLILGCSSNPVRRCKKDFDKMISQPITPSKRIEVVNKFKEAKKELSTEKNKEKYTLEERSAMEKEIDYYLMILEDLGD